MTHELMKELQDAGFPGNIPDDEAVKSDFRDPTLTNLLEACGERFSSLNKLQSEWCALARCKLNPEEDFDEAHGQTPEEAVARLWLALNQPKS